MVNAVVKSIEDQIVKDTDAVREVLVASLTDSEFVVALKKKSGDDVNLDTDRANPLDFYYPKVTDLVQGIRLTRVQVGRGVSSESASGNRIEFLFSTATESDRLLAIEAGAIEFVCNMHYRCEEDLRVDQAVYGIRAYLDLDNKELRATVDPKRKEIEDLQKRLDKINRELAKKDPEVKGLLEE